MKNGRTHRGVKGEHLIDLDSEGMLSITVRHGVDGDAWTLMESVVNTQWDLILVGSVEECRRV